MPPNSSDSGAAYPADLYAAVHGGNPGDVAWYRAACAGARSVLELGCGSGRVGGALVEAGHVLAGLDLDRGALELAAARGVEAVYGDMRRFELGRRFDRVLIPYNGLYYLLDDAAVVDCLGAAARHLAPAGSLHFDVWAADEIDFAAAAAADGPPSLVATVDVRGMTWDVWETTATNSRERRIDVSYRHVPRDGSPPLTAVIRQRALTSAAITRLLARAGLRVIAMHGGFAGENFGPESEFCVVSAARR